MAEEKIFVGRKAELEQFEEVLKNPKGLAVLVVGQAGMGKTWLVNKMAELAENHPKLKCGWVRYEVTPTDSVDSTMALMMDEGFEAAASKIKKGIRLGGRSKQWSALLSAVGLIPFVGNKAKTIGELVMSLRREPTKDTRKQFIEKLNYISEMMPENGRVMFIIDPEKYMQKESDQSWAIVVKQLPEKIKFVFAQRPGDALVDSETIDALTNVIRIPSAHLREFNEKEVEKLIDLRAGEADYSQKQLREGFGRYKGHPYALGAALDSIETGTKLEELPESAEPTKFAQVQWRKVSNSSDGAIELFEAYAVLEVGVPDDIVEAVSRLKSSKRRKLLADKYLAGLLREEGEGKRIYHAILADYIVEQIGEAEKNQYHSRAVEVYHEKLARAKKEQIRSDALAAMRLAEHVLSAEGKEAFVGAFVSECFEPLHNLGLFDAAISLSQRALEMVEKNSKEEARVMGNLGVIYRRRGELDKAEEMHKKSLEIEEKLGRLGGMASEYGSLGLIYYTRGELDKAEQMYKRALGINEKLGHKKGMANQYSSLGLAYFARGKLGEAEKMHLKGLEIEKKLVRLEGIAREYGNLGNVYYTRGALDKAEEMYKKSLEISESRGMIGLSSNQYGNLGSVYKTRDELDKAEEMHLKSLKIKEKLGMQEGIANSYVNLGSVYGERGDIGTAREYWEKAVALYERIGMPHMVEKVQGWIDGLK